MAIKVRQTGSFRAASDAGQEFTIYEFTEYEEKIAADGTVSEVDRGKLLRCAAAVRVDRLKKGEYAVVTATGTIITRSTDPGAP